jgi:antitoxin MazE
MKAQVVPIGNSRGVRIPKALLELCRIQQVVDLSVKGETLLIRPVKRRPRAGWEAAFQAMHERHDDRLLIGDRVDLDLGSWEW